MEVLVLDGGTGHLLKAKGIEQLVPGLAYDQLFLAGTLANIHQPELVKEVHREYVVAGADVLTTNSFACTSYSLSKIGKACQAAELISSAARLAREVADQAGRQVQVAGTLPPLQESYQTHGLPSPDDMQQQYRQIAAALLPHVDLLLCETLATVAEGLAAATVASESGKPWWISWTLEDNLSARLRSGEALEDIEKLGSKRGVISQSIKDVLQSLVDDDLVRQEKIGISNYFWSFPSDTAVKLETDIGKLQQRLEERQAERQRLDTQLEESKVGKEDSGERQELVRQLKQLEERVAQQKAELAKYSDNDPERYEAMREAIHVAKDSSNRWLDNIYTLETWLKRKFEGMKEEVDNLFKESGVNDKLEYLEVES
ncbi:hypothetical protein N2152v2_003227 [Parachlorella kessleri]